MGLITSSHYKFNMNIQLELGLKAHQVLGRGSYATVYYCTRTVQDPPYAVKVFQKKDFTKSKLHYFRKQAEILASIEHPNIVKFYEFKQTPSCIYLLMEYIPGGTLRNLMAGKWAKNQKFSDTEISLILRSILEGIKYLHKYNIIHRDLKPGMYFKYKVDNILLHDPGDLASLKIVDFGLSAQLDFNYPKNVKAQCGTLLYMAPQILYQPSYNKGVDIWSCAIMMYQLYTGGMHPIYRDGMKTDEFKEELKQCQFPPLSNDLAQNFIKRLSKRDYNERYSVNEALQHPWITRNQYDQIPLSVNELIQSFTITDKVADALKFCLTIGQLQRKKFDVPLSYRKKIKDFIKDHQQTKSRSPSMKKMRSRKKQSSKKARDPFLQISDKFDDKKQRPSNKSDEAQSLSPLVKKHQHLYLRLFEKQKSSIFKEKLFDLKQCSFPSNSIENDSFQLIEEDQLPPPSPVKTEKISYGKSEEITYQVRNKKFNFDSLFDVQLVNLRKTAPPKEQETKNKVKKVKSLREDGKVSKVDLDLNFMQSKLRVSKKNSFDQRTQSIRNTSKPKKSVSKNDGMKEYLLEPLSATRKAYSSKTKTVKEKQMGKRPMIFGTRGGVSYL